MTTPHSEHVFAQLKKLGNDARVTKDAHFIAKERKRWWFKFFGIIGIVFNVLVATGVLDLIPGQPAIYIKIAAVFAGAFAAIQTLLNLQKETELHSQAGEAYTQTYRRIILLIAEFEDGQKDAAQMTDEYRQLMEKHLKVNTTFANCVPDNKDFEKARIKLGIVRSAVADQKPHEGHEASAAGQEK